MKLEEAIQSSKFKNPAHRAALNVLYSAWWLRTLTNQTLKPHGLTHEQYNVLRILNGKHPEAMCVKDIAGRVIEKSSNLPRIISRLVAKKWVKSSPGPSDRRESHISLTATGISVLALASADMEQVMEQRVRLGNEDAALLHQLLEKMRGE
jgi:DNA-binding MarR family transcriptional regulator